MGHSLTQLDLPPKINRHSRTIAGHPNTCMLPLRSHEFTCDIVKGSKTRFEKLGKFDFNMKVCLKVKYSLETGIVFFPSDCTVSVVTPGQVKAKDGFEVKKKILRKWNLNS